MSLIITKPGILDSIQDAGRFGYMHLGINPAGVMDSFSAAMANIHAGNAMHEPVLEMHFPAPVIHFEKQAIIALSGADFTATIQEQTIPLNESILIAENTSLRFDRPTNGARCYLSVHGGFDIPLWLSSTSTHFKLMAGGYAGRRLMKGDRIGMKHPISLELLQQNTFEILPWGKNHSTENEEIETVYFLSGNEFDWLTPEAKHNFSSGIFTISAQSDRMGYHLNGPVLCKEVNEELVSSPVTFGAIQLLPDDHLIVLMADHQTTGGYPRIGHIISAHLSRLAQKKPGDQIRFEMVDIRKAEQMHTEQKQLLVDLERDTKEKIRKTLEKNN